MWLLIVKYKKTIILGIALITVGAFLTYSFVSPRGYFSGLKNDLKIVDPQEEFSYTDLQGNQVRLSDLKGRPIIINSWATWMPFSRNELLLLNEIAQQYEGGVHIVAINRMEQLPTVQAYMNEVGTLGNIKIWADPTDNFYKAVGGYAMPETVTYNRDGSIVGHVRGVLKKEELVAQIEGMISGE